MDPYDAIMALLDEEDRIEKQEMMARLDAVRILSEKFSDRELVFTTGFEGNLPIQAFGTLDGTPFYFRFRRGLGSLTVGEPDPQAALKKYARDLKHATRNVDMAIETGSKVLFRHTVSLQEPDTKRPMPFTIRQSSTVDTYEENPRNVLSSAEEIVDLFSRLVDTLVDHK